MKYLTSVACHIEDRRDQYSKDKPSVVIEMTCEDCDVTFLVVAAVAAATNFSRCCAPCQKFRSVLVMHRYKKPGVGAKMREIRLARKESAASVWAKATDYDCAILYDGYTKMEVGRWVRNRVD